MSNIKSIVVVLAVMLMLTGIASAETLTLTQKDSTWTEFGNKATLTYNSMGPIFDYTLTGNVPLNENYALVYYKDQTDPSVNWGLIGAVIADNIVPVESDNKISVSGSKDIGTIPQSDDLNSPNGAKIWLVPTSNLNTDKTSLVIGGWHPGNYLFEENLRVDGVEQPATSHLITYTKTKLSDGVSDTVGTLILLAEVTGLNHSGVTKNSITWSWTNPTGSGFVGTRVTVSSGGVPISGYDHKAVSSGTQSITVSGLTAGTSYTILVQTEWIN